MRNVKTKNERRILRPDEGITLGTDPTLGAEMIKNMYLPRGGRGLESIPGYRIFLSLEGCVHTILPLSPIGGECLIIHAGDKLYRIDKSECGGKPSPIAYLKDEKSVGISLGTTVILSDTEKVISVDTQGIRILSEDSDLCACRLMTFYDGRLFLSGNPSLPGVTFYSSQAHGAPPENMKEGFFREGPAPNLALLGRADGLYILRRDLDGGGGLVRRTPAKGGYERSLAVSGISATDGISRYGRLFLLCDGGIYMLEGDGTSLTCVSEDIASLLSDGGYRLCGEWQGHILLQKGSDILMGRLSSLMEKGRGWFMLSGIGDYEGDSRLFRYSAEKREGFELHPCPDSPSRGEPMSLINEEGETVYFERSEDKRYLLYPTQQRVGGRLIPPTEILCDGELLWLGCQSGKIMIFNNGCKAADLFGIENYYSFAGHAPEYLIKLYPDGCGSEERKATVNATLFLRLKKLNKSAAHLTVSYDGHPVLSEMLSFSPADFSSLDFEGLSAEEENALTMREPKGLWRRKQITLSSLGTPFGILSLEYLYETKK